VRARRATATATSPPSRRRPPGTYLLLGRLTRARQLRRRIGPSTGECFTRHGARPGSPHTGERVPVVLGISNTDGATVTGGNGHPHGHRHLLRVGPPPHCTTLGHQAGSGSPWRARRARPRPPAPPSRRRPPAPTASWASTRATATTAGGSDASTGECFTVTVAPARVATQPGAVPWCSAISNTDGATVTGWGTVTPTGTVTFYVCGPSATTCTTSGTKLEWSPWRARRARHGHQPRLHGAGHRHLLLLGRLLGRRQLRRRIGTPPGECSPSRWLRPG